MRFEGRETKLGVRAWEGAVHHQEIEIRQDRREVAREARGPGAIGARFATALAARLLPVREEAQAPHAGNLRLTLRAGRLRAAEDEGDERAIRVFGRGRERGAQPCVAAAPAQCPGEARFGIVDSERPVDARGELAVDWPPDRVRAGERRVKGSGQLRWWGRSRECGEQHRSRVPHRDGKHRTLVSVFASRAAALGTTERSARWIWHERRATCTRRGAAPHPTTRAYGSRCPVAVAS